MENFAVVSAFILGLFGSVFSIIQFFYQRSKDKAQSEREKVQAEREAEREAARDKAQAEKDKAQAEKEAAAEAARVKEQAEREAARVKEQLERDKEQDLKDRLTFLTQVIIDKDIPRESRQPFYDEYIKKGGNGTVIKFWLENK